MADIVQRWFEAVATRNDGGFSARPPPDHFKVYVNEYVYFFEPVYMESVNDPATLQISRPDGSIKINEPVMTGLPAHHSFIAFGILGMIRLLAGFYIVVVTQRTLICNLLGKSVWRIDGTKVLPCHVDDSQLTDWEKSDEEQYLLLLKQYLATKSLYYSDRLDLTRTIQSIYVEAVGTNPTSPQSARPWQYKSNQVYFANLDLVQPFFSQLTSDASFSSVSRVAILACLCDKPNMNGRHLAGGLVVVQKMVDFIVVCIEGFIQAKTVYLNDLKLSLALVSRRSVRRTGTRYHSRGIDESGSVSNHVESEQIVSCGNAVASFVQLRGSLPIYWRQNINMQYTPRIEVYNIDAVERAFRQHFGYLKSQYEAVIAVNLVNHHGREGELAKLFAKQIRILADPNIRYVHFDFHHNCRGTKYHKISLLVDKIETELNEHDFFLVDGTVSERAQSLQHGIVRSNCVDCLDRTNVVQSVLALRSLTLQLRELGVLGQTEKVEHVPKLYSVFRNVWADNADMLSLQYAGTGALKTDFTRTGKRSILGVLQDGYRSLNRYFLGNLMDGARQDSIDLFFGKYKPQLGRVSPFQSHDNTFSLLVWTSNLLSKS